MRVCEGGFKVHAMLMWKLEDMSTLLTSMEGDCCDEWVGG